MSEEHDHERIFLAPLDEPEDPDQGRMWCEDEGNWESPGVEFIRIDLHEAALAAARLAGKLEGIEACAQWHDEKAAAIRSTSVLTTFHIELMREIHIGAADAHRARIKEGASE